jgi:hypothetical protein
MKRFWEMIHAVLFHRKTEFRKTTGGCGVITRTNGVIVIPDDVPRETRSFIFEFDKPIPVRDLIDVGFQLKDEYGVDFTYNFYEESSERSSR